MIRYIQKSKILSQNRIDVALFIRIIIMHYANDKYVQSVPKKMSFSGKTAITTFKLIQNAKVGGVLENSGYLLQHGHRDFQN